MRNTIRLPADVEFAVSLINNGIESVPEDAAFKVEMHTEQAGKFKRVTKVTLSVVKSDGSCDTVIVISPKERKTL